ncbi:MAG: hypothetical protein IPN71_14245 [Fibrobacteres bacterium]|nr:hypothetical protein [Fibrobacterota bacterium]
MSEDRTLSFEPGTNLVWNAPLRTLHCALLLEGGIELAREFWLGHPMEALEGAVSGVDLYRHLWKEQSWSPLEYQLRVMESVEAFCLYHNIDFVRFVRDKVFGLQSGGVLSARGSLALVGNFLFQLVRTRDIYQTMLEVLDGSTRILAPMTTTRMVYRDIVPGYNRGWILHVHDPVFSKSLPGYDCDVWLGTQLEMAPLRIGLAPYPYVYCHGEVREIPAILGGIHRGPHPVWQGDCWWLDGAPISRPERYHHWFSQLGLPVSEIAQVPDHEIQVALQDIECPARKRVVIRAGRAYGTHGYLVEMRWKKGGGHPVEQGISHLIHSAMADDLDAMDLACQRHEDLLLQYRHRLCFVFHHQDETISCNGEHLLRGVPAKILQKVLMAHTLTGRSSFENREFRRDPDLGLDPLNPNLESRIKILSERLEERLVGFRILKNGRGRFDLETSTLVEFQEA